MSKFLWQCLCLAAFALNDQAIAADDGPQTLLKGIKSIYYVVYVEPTVGGDQCKISGEDLATSLQFIANQSTKLHIITHREHTDRVEELYHESELSGRPGDKSDAVAKTARDYNFMPRLFIAISPLQQGGGCAGHIEARLSARIFSTDATIIPTGASIRYPSIEVWAKIYGFVHSRQMFSEYVVNVAGQMMKAFVNDWTVSQEE